MRSHSGANVQTIRAFRYDTPSIRANYLQDINLHIGRILLGDRYARYDATPFHFLIQETRVNPSGYPLRAITEAGLNLIVSHDQLQRL